MFKKNKDGMDTTKLIDTILSALQMENEHYTIQYNDYDFYIYWKHHTVRIKGECIWFDKKKQHSVYSVVNCIKAGN